MMVTLQDLNPEVEGLEELRLNKMDKAAALISHQV